ncbi:hypothetical protein GBA52_006096 [Prunus armeniaca]|nr:hypothetical protein GBA52_006096 [Prunus armeniaca]
MASLVSIFLLLALTSFFSSSSAEVSRKELRSEEANKETFIHFGHSVHSNRIDPSRAVQLSWRPRVFLYQGFLSDEECDHLVSLAHGGEENSLTEYDDLGNTNTIRLRKSLQIPLNMEDEIVSRIEERISAWTFLPKENSRALQVSRNGVEEAEKNLNFFGNKSTLEQSEPLIATVILYISNVTRGGEILFPESELRSEVWSDCGKSSSILKPTKGNAILFFTLRPNASPDKSSPHSRCPVLEGEMWCATKFIYAKAIGGEKVSPDSESSECTDEDDNCPNWASIGECQRNPVFMVGSPDYYGTCRKSCNVC